MRILIREGSGPWREPEPKGYAVESDLQAILAEHPELIPGVGAAALTCREFQSGVGPADVMAVDADGQLTLVECKLASNRQVRREVVGQMFDYAARLWRMPIEEFESAWRMRLGSELFGTDDAAARENLADNLAEGRFRLVIAVDAINEPLKRMIGYLNAMSGPETEVLAVEYLRFGDGGREILTPQVYGQEHAEAKRALRTGAPANWSASAMQDWLEQEDGSAVPLFAAFVDEANRHALQIVGAKGPEPSISVPVWGPAGRRLGAVALRHYTKMGTSIEIDLGRLSRTPQPERPDEADLAVFIHALDSIPGLGEVARNLRTSDFASRKPNVPLSALGEAGIRRAVAAVAELSRGR